MNYYDEWLRVVDLNPDYDFVSDLFVKGAATVGVGYFAAIKAREVAMHFIASRKTARLGAIAAMGAIRSRLRRERERGVKDVSRIIGRLIWESRKYYLSEESPTLSKRIKNE